MLRHKAKRRWSERVRAGFGKGRGLSHLSAAAALGGESVGVDLALAQLVGLDGPQQADAVRQVATERPRRAHSLENRFAQ